MAAKGSSRASASTSIAHAGAASPRRFLEHEWISRIRDRRAELFRTLRYSVGYLVYQQPAPDQRGLA
jgi:hypothetical protein